MMYDSSNAIAQVAEVNTDPESSPAGFCVFFEPGVKNVRKTGSGVTFYFQQ